MTDRPVGRVIVPTRKRGAQSNAEQEVKERVTLGNASAIGVSASDVIIEAKPNAAAIDTLKWIPKAP